MQTRFRKSDVRFDVADGHLVRTVTATDGRSYVHRCSRDVYESVAHAMQSVGPDGATVDTLAVALDAPYTQVNVALEFLKERSCVQTRHRRNYPSSDIVFEDAMIEFLALVEEQKEVR
jgi:hypothetical protein